MRLAKLQWRASVYNEKEGNHYIEDTILLNIDEIENIHEEWEFARIVTKSQESYIVRNDWVMAQIYEECIKFL